MRSMSKIYRLPSAIILAMTLTTAPSYADDIVFVPGTGSSAYPETNRDDIAATGNAQNELLDTADLLRNPAAQDAAAIMTERLGETILRLPVGKLASAIERARPGTIENDIDEDATVADIAGPDAAALPSQLGKQSRIAMEMAGGLAEAFSAFLPELEQLGRDLGKSMADIKAKRR